MQSQDRALYSSASRGKNEPTKIRRVELVYCIGLLVCGVKLSTDTKLIADIFSENIDIVSILRKKLISTHF